jgi:hypothetical protein
MIIEDNIPIPTEQTYGGRPPIPLAQMEVGQSVFVPESVKTAPNVRCYANQVGDRLKRRFTCRKVTENSQAGLRVWRIA